MFHLVADDPSQKQTALTIAENLTQDGSVGTSDIAVVVQADGIEPLTAGGDAGTGATVDLFDRCYPQYVNDICQIGG